MKNETFRLITLDETAAPELFALSPVVAEAIALAVGGGDAPPTVIVRRQAPYALLGPQDRRLPRLAAGIAVLQAAGLPVYERIAGGTAVILDEQCVSFAVAKPCRDLTTIHRNFHELTAGVRFGLARFGLNAEFGAAAGSFCEGDYDLVVDGLKIAGVAQALRRGFTLVSGMVLVKQNPAPVTDLLNEFYAAAGGEPDLIPDNVTNMEQLLGRPVSISEVEQAITEGFAEAHGLHAAPLTAGELAQARELSPVRRIA